MTDAQVEAVAKAIYPTLQNILNNRPRGYYVMPEFVIARAALAAIEAEAPDIKTILAEADANYDEGFAAGVEAAAKEVERTNNKPHVAYDIPSIIRALRPPVPAGAPSQILDEVIGKLSAAALQSSPKDDQIIADHIRDSVALLLKYRHKMRERAASAGTPSVLLTGVHPYGKPLRDK